MTMKFPTSLIPVLLSATLALSCATGRVPSPQGQNFTRRQVLAAPERYITVGSRHCDAATLQEAVAQVRPGRVEIVLMDAVHTEAGTVIDRDLVLRGFGPEATVLQAAPSAEQAADRVLQVEAEAAVRVYGLTIRNGNPSGPYRSGGGIRNYGELALQNCAVRDNTAVYGAGILNKGVLTLRACTVAGNRGLPMSAAEHLDATGCTGSGGGIKNEPGGRLVLEECTISGNVSLRKGGGLFVSCESTVLLVNCTISGNESRRTGGGIHIRGDAELIHCTVAANRSHKQGGGVYNLGRLEMIGCIIAGNERIDFVMGEGGGFYGRGEVGINAWNLVADGSYACALGGDPRLGPLQDNGGPTLTHALRKGSTALDVIPREELFVLADQRGRPRLDGVGDAGAFERR
jgi:hypothetical protein